MHRARNSDFVFISWNARVPVARYAIWFHGLAFHRGGPAPGSDSKEIQPAWSERCRSRTRDETIITRRHGRCSDSYCTVIRSTVIYAHLCGPWTGCGFDLQPANGITHLRVVRLGRVIERREDRGNPLLGSGDLCFRTRREHEFERCILSSPRESSKRNRKQRNQINFASREPRSFFHPPSRSIRRFTFSFSTTPSLSFSLSFFLSIIYSRKLTIENFRATFFGKISLAVFNLKLIQKCKRRDCDTRQKISKIYSVVAFLRVIRLHEPKCLLQDRCEASSLLVRDAG